MVKVYTSSVIDAPAGRVWALIRDFNGLPNWVPVVADSRIEGGVPADKVGCIRNFNLKDGGNLREQLLALSDYDYSFTYNILVSEIHPLARGRGASRPPGAVRNKTKETNGKEGKNPREVR